MVADVTFDSNGTLWIAATGEGVFSYRFDTGKLTNYRHDTADPHSISNNNVNNITQDSKGNLWFATSGSGLDLYRPASNDFENFDQAKNGLSSDCIYETQESPHQRQTAAHHQRRLLHLRLPAKGIPELQCRKRFPNDCRQ